MKTKRNITIEVNDYLELINHLIMQNFYTPNIKKGSITLKVSFYLLHL